MNDALSQVATYAVNATWQVALFCAVGWGLCRVFRHAGPRLHHRVWVATLLLATAAPATSVVWPHVRAARSSATAWTAPDAVNSAFRVLVEPGLALLVPSTGLRLLAALYLGVVLIFAARLAWMTYTTARMIRRSRSRQAGREADALWRHAKKAFGVPAAVIRHSADVSGPVATGFSAHILLLPEAFFERHSRTEALAAIGHECAHISRHDFWKNLFYEGVSLLVAFHPLTWFIKNHLAGTREMICDRMAADRLADPASYAQSLIALAAKVSWQKRAPSSAVGMFDADILERRIVTLTRPQTSVTFTRRLLGDGMAVVFLSLGFIASWWVAPTIAAQGSGVVPPGLIEVLGRENLACSYYGRGDDGVFAGHPGTCWVAGGDEPQYRCFMNARPTNSNLQIACAAKVQRAFHSLRHEPEVTR